jgi:hypothetical protein
MRIRNALAALAVAAVFASSPASAGPNANVHYGHSPALLQAAVIMTMLSASSLVFNSIIISQTQNRQMTLQEAYWCASLPFICVVAHQQVTKAALQRKRRR